MAMIKAEVKNLRRVPTAVWVGKKRYVFPANINVRMNLDEAMLIEIQRNPAFSVKVISRTEEPQVEVKASEEAKASEESPKQEAQIETVEDVKAEEIPAPAPVSVDEEAVESEVVEAEEASDESEEANDEATDDVSHKDLFSMKKDELAAYLASKGVNAEGMSRKDMLKAAKRV
jgi:hypothetical protein